MKETEQLLGDNSSFERFSDPRFKEWLNYEKLRAQRTNSTLSIVLLNLKNDVDAEFVNMNEILDEVRAVIRLIDIAGLVNNKTIGILLPDTDEKGAMMVSEKLNMGDKFPEFSITISSYPDDIFESLAKTGCVQAGVFPFESIHSPDSSYLDKLIIKRAVDIVGSIIGIVVFSPLMLITALIIKSTSPGPVIFKQPRLGKRGVLFEMYKFRSMYVNRDDQIHREYVKNFISGDNEKVNQGDEGKPFYKNKHDPRITKVGRFIRKTSIDEFPQFFNVLKGDMSLVGPRPPLPYEVEQYQSWQLQRILRMKPGITGLWQVEGRGKTIWDDSVRLDIKYIHNWSILFDIKLLFKTIAVVLSGKGAV